MHKAKSNLLKMLSFFVFKITLLLLICGLARCLPTVNDATESGPSSLQGTNPFEMEHPKYLSPYVHESSRSLKNNYSTQKLTDEKEQMKKYEANTTSLVQPKSREHVNQLSLVDKMILVSWTFIEIVKIKLFSLKDDSYVKKLYIAASELNREDVCVPFVLGLLAGLVFLVTLSLCRFCLRRFCCRRPVSVNRIKGYKKRLLNKRIPLDETHRLLMSHHDLSDQEV